MFDTNAINECLAEIGRMVKKMVDLIVIAIQEIQGEATLA